MYLTTTRQQLRLFSAEWNKKSLSVQLGIQQGYRLYDLSSNPGRGQNIFESQQGATHFYLLRSFLFNGYRFFFTGGGGH